MVSAESGAGTLKRVADSTAVGGYALQWDGSENATIYQDIPIKPGSSYATFISWRYTNSASEFAREIGYQFRDATHGAIGSEIDAGIAYATSLAAYAIEVLDTSAVAPANARYLRVILHISRTSGSPTVWVNAMFAGATQHWGGLRVMQGGIGIFNLATDANPVTTLAVGGGLQFGTASTASDVYMRRSAAKTLNFDSDGAGAALTKFSVPGALEVHGGTSFPGSPATNDTYYRTDLNDWYQYDGTRWLSATEYCVPIDVSAADISADPTYLRGVPAAPVAAGTFRYTRMAISLVVRTTHTATKYWNIQLYDEGIGAIYSTDSWAIKPSADAFGSSLQVPAVSDSGVGAIAIKLTKTSTPGNLFIRIGLYGRLIAT